MDTLRIRLMFMVLIGLMCLGIAESRVSKSFVRGFLVGYAKGLEEGKALVQLQPVLYGDHGPYGGPEPESGPHGPEGSDSNDNHVRSNQHASAASNPEPQNKPHPLASINAKLNPQNLKIANLRSLDEKKAATSLAIQQAVLNKYRA